MHRATSAICRMAVPVAASIVAVAQDAKTPPTTQPTTKPVLESPLRSEHCESHAASMPSKPTGGFLFWPPPAPLSGAIATDRPGFADTTFVVPRGHVQLEMGYAFTADSEGRDHLRDHSFAQTNLRIGLLDNLELRTLWNGYSMTRSEFIDESPRTGRRFRATDHDDGAGDMTLGLRTQLLRNDGLVPDLSFLVNLSIPVGSGGKTAGDVVPDARLAYGWALTDKLRLYGVGIAAVPVGDNERFFQAAGSAGLSYAWTDRLGTFIEYYGIFPGRKDEDCAHNLDGGFAFLLGDNCQLDFSAGLGLNEQAPDYFVGFGVSFRW